MLAVHLPVPVCCPHPYPSLSFPAAGRKTLVIAAPLLLHRQRCPRRKLEGGMRKGGRMAGRPCGSRWRNPRGMQNIPESCCRSLVAASAYPLNLGLLQCYLLGCCLLAGRERDRRNKQAKEGTSKCGLETLHYIVKPSFQNFYSHAYSGQRTHPTYYVLLLKLTRHTWVIRLHWPPCRALVSWGSAGG